jgi:hypothetical protein
LPLYKSKKFEDGIKKWMVKEMAQREKEFKLAMQISEREIMQSFAFQKDISMNTSAKSSLSETMGLDGDHVKISYNTEFEGSDLTKVKKLMRRINPQFSD